MSRLEFTKQMRKDHPEVYENNWGTSYVHQSIFVPRWVEIGNRVIIHQGVTLGTQGFGFEKDDDGKWLHIPHIGKLIIEDDVEIFEHCNLCRGTIGDTIIGAGTKIDTFCHIGHNAKIGKNCILTSGVIFGGSSILGDDVYIGLNATIIDHANIVKGVFIGSHSNVVKSISDPYTVWAGNPAKLFGLRPIKTEE